MNDAVSAGGRAYAKVGKSEVGASFINEGAQWAIPDWLRWIPVSSWAKLRSYVPKWRVASPTIPRAPAAADAYFTELKQSASISMPALISACRTTAFGFGQQLSTETGSRKAGVDARYRLNDVWSMRGEAQHQETDGHRRGTRNGDSASTARNATHYSWSGCAARADTNTTIGDTKRRAGFVTGSIKLLDQRVTLRAEQDLSLSGSSDVTDYPDRSLLGVDYLLSRDTTLLPTTNMPMARISMPT